MPELATSLACIEAVYDHVLIQRAKISDTTEGGVKLPASMVEGSKLCYGLVLRAGPACKQVKPGDIAIFDEAESREVFFPNKDKTHFSVLIEKGIYGTMDRKTAQMDLGIELPLAHSMWGVTPI